MARRFERARSLERGLRHRAPLRCGGRAHAHSTRCGHERRGARAGRARLLASRRRRLTRAARARAAHRARQRSESARPHQRDPRARHIRRAEHAPDRRSDARRQCERACRGRRGARRGARHRAWTVDDGVEGGHRFHVSPQRSHLRHVAGCRASRRRARRAGQLGASERLASPRCCCRRRRRGTEHPPPSRDLAAARARSGSARALRRLRCDGAARRYRGRPPVASRVHGVRAHRRGFLRSRDRDRLARGSRDSRRGAARARELPPRAKPTARPTRASLRLAFSPRRGSTTAPTSRTP